MRDSARTAARAVWCRVDRMTDCRFVAPSQPSVHTPRSSAARRSPTVRLTLRADRTSRAAGTRDVGREPQVGQAVTLTEPPPGNGSLVAAIVLQWAPTGHPRWTSQPPARASPAGVNRSYTWSGCFSRNCGSGTGEPLGGPDSDRIQAQRRPSPKRRISTLTSIAWPSTRCPDACRRQGEVEAER